MVLAQKQKYRPMEHDRKPRSNGTEEFIYRAAMEKQTGNRLIDMERGEERVRCMERVTWKLTLPYAK